MLTNADMRSTKQSFMLFCFRLPSSHSASIIFADSTSSFKRSRQHSVCSHSYFRALSSAYLHELTIFITENLSAIPAIWHAGLTIITGRSHL